MLNSIKRNCLLCQSNNYKKLFNMTYDWVRNVRGSNPKTKYGWNKNTNIWIVECKNCGCHYVPEIIKGMALESSKKKN